ncbi:MAG: PLP-dependent transferase, partial [Proteobacteria bacterium]|nr:PLP-dependent transferase [Pseudomonadota bacterium]MBU1710211.1 PLP-dependent transferase [Pseudomonadota bacterium]
IENAMKVADYLQNHQKTTWVKYPGLKDNPSYPTAKKQFAGKGFGGLIAFGLKDQQACFKFINNLKMIYHLANLGDCKSLVIHPYSSQYVAFPEPIRQLLSITPDLVRLSVGIEGVEDIIADIEQALETVS